MPNAYTKHCQECIYYSKGKTILCSLHIRLRRKCKDKILNKGAEKHGKSN